ncbi:MAG: hypothetical protein FWE70_08400, partial [Oscillospiraceae bacterium]|nr:hypothetical protein [Oscillospiraceae bacterium]
YRALGLADSCGMGLALLEVEPVTGRPHQIRAQLSHAGLPILGDVKYGTGRRTAWPDAKTGLTGLALDEPAIAGPAPDWPSAVGPPVALPILEGPALWSHRLAFEHPISHAIMSFLSYPPARSYPWSLFAELPKGR